LTPFFTGAIKFIILIQYRLATLWAVNSQNHLRAIFKGASSLSDCVNRPLCTPQIPQTCHVSDHVSKEGIASDVEGHPEAHVAGALVQLAGQLAVCDVELKTKTKLFQNQYAKA
jgi:hypothetical protein